MEKKRIIIAEDDNDSLFMMVTVLQNNGYEVLGLKDGSTIIEGHCLRPDLFILDKVMDLYDGITISNFLKTSPLGISTPIMMISGSSNTKEIDAANIDLFLIKPFDTEHLLSSVDSLIYPTNMQLIN